MTHAYKPNIAKTGGLRGQGQFGLHSQSLYKNKLEYKMPVWHLQGDVYIVVLLGGQMYRSGSFHRLNILYPKQLGPEDCQILELL